jgi:cytosolic carboxypeptidase protein 6
MRLFVLLLSLCLLLSACSLFRPGRTKGTSYDPKNSTDTHSRPLDYQVKRTFRLDGLSASNHFAGARLNGFERIGEGHYRALIEPENTPINNSPWYAFQLWAETPQEIRLTLAYAEPGSHRYYPKLSRDGQSWTPLDSSRFSRDTTTGTATMRLALTPEPLYVAGQELISAATAYAWEDSLASLPGVRKARAGYSTLGRPIHALHFGAAPGAPTVVLLGRQHPAEVPGYLASQAFVHALLADTELARRFRQRFHLIALPQLNPDGADLGHWRHSAGGIDLNRDWEFFRQPEPAAVRDYLTTFTTQHGREIVLGLDFHGTQEDMFYILTEDLEPQLDGFARRWLAAIQAELPEHEPVIEAYGMDSPSAKYFFYTQFKADFVTYEVGDENDRGFIAHKAAVAAQLMMALLLGE